MASAIWLIWAEGKELGPFTLKELCHHPLLTPDSWVRREHDTMWRKARNVPELQEHFKDREEFSPISPDEKVQPIDELTLEMAPPPFPFLWMLLIALVTYLCYWLLRGE